MRECDINNVVVGEEAFGIIQEARMLAISLGVDEYHPGVLMPTHIWTDSLNANNLRLLEACRQFARNARLADEEGIEHLDGRAFLSWVTPTYTIQERISWCLERDLWAVRFGLSHPSIKPWRVSEWANAHILAMRVVG